MDMGREELGNVPRENLFLVLYVARDIVDFDGAVRGARGESLAVVVELCIVLFVVFVGETLGYILGRILRSYHRVGCLWRGGGRRQKCSSSKRERERKG
jgi:hypothetical protein